MPANQLDTATYNSVAANTVFDAVIDNNSILAWRQNLKTVVDQHAVEIDSKMPGSGGTMTDNIIFNNTKGVLLKEAGGTIRHALSMNSINEIGIGVPSNPLTLYSANTVYFTSSGASIKLSYGTGSPEGVVTSGVGSLHLRTDGAAATTLYVKTSGTGNTGWTAK